MAWYANQGVIQIGPQMTFHSETTSTTSQSGHMSLNAQLDTDGSWEYILSSNKASNYYQYQGTHNWRVAAAGTAGNDITWTTAMSLDNDGNLGIGNTSPSSYYSTFDNLVIGTTGANGITIVSSTNQVGTVAFADGTSGNETYRGFVQYNHSADELYLGTSGATQLTMDDDGNVGIGASSPNVNLEIMGSDSYDAKMRFAYGTGSANSYANWGYKANSDGNKIFLSIANGGSAADILVAQADGKVGIGTNTPSAKLHIKHAGGGFDEVARLTSVANSAGAVSYTHLRAHET